MNKDKGLQNFCDEVCRVNEEEGEWSGPSKIGGIDF